MITPRKFEEQMKEILEENENPKLHEKMDELMCEVLKCHGYDSGVKIFENAPKWYA